MSNGDSLACYSFLPWLRQGIANNIQTNPAAGQQRASIRVSLDVESDTGLKETLSNTIQMVGPGDIIGLSRRAIVRSEPQDWSSDFEPNFLPLIEFYDEDFPWRYSPMPADTAKHRITPWLTLAVLSEAEFDDGAHPDAPLPFFDISGDPLNLLPDTSQLWAWAHVHVNENIKQDNTGSALSDQQAVDQLELLLDANPDSGYSRLICPRRLQPATDYHAFLIPTFETGRLAGLGLDIGAAVNALDFAWGGGQTRFPIYYRWFFRTGERGDFEYLVRLLQPRPVDNRVGIRDMDVSDPGAGFDGIDMGEGQPKVMGMEGALRSPQTESTPWPQTYPEPFQQQLAEFINKADDDQQANPDTDPVITPPMYGRWHALRQRLSLDADTGSNPYDPQRKWLTELNLDPRHRSAAGLGTRVVQQNQEAYMNQAWQQIGDVLEANRRLKLAQFAELASLQAYKKHFKNLHPNLFFSITQPVHQRVLGSRETVYVKIKNSRLPQATLSPEFRRAIRPRGNLARRLLPDAGRRPQADLVARINDDEITATPPKKSPAGSASLPAAAEQLEPANLPDWLKDLLRSPLTRWLPVIIAVFIIILFTLAGLGLISGSILILLVAALVALQMQFLQWSKKIEAGDTIKEENLTPEAVDEMPLSPEFRITDPDEDIQFNTGSHDSVEALRFKSALKDLHTQLVDRPPADTPPLAAALGGLSAGVMAVIDPRVTIYKRVMSTILLPPVIRQRIPDRIVPVMAYPEFPQPTYEPLRDISSELLCPNIDLVPPNTLSLLITNQKFIESYLVGLNHEMGRELLWSEYPNDQRGSYFRQFWDVYDFVNKEENLSEQQLVEKLKDIPEIHTWISTSVLGTHNHRESGTDTEQLVLLVRGELLKRYPNTVIYAHRAQWQLDSANNIDKNRPRKLAPIETKEEQEANEKYPLYSAQVLPDIFFIGFDLTVEEARGLNEDDPGWFFVLKERVGEPRFGLDIEAAAINSWDDFNWEAIDDDLTAGGYVTLTSDTTEFQPGSNTDGVQWHDQSNAADIAYILYQDPVLVAVHAEEMLPKEDE